MCKHLSTLLYGRNSIFLSAPRSQFVLKESQKKLKIWSTDKVFMAKINVEYKKLMEGR